MSNPRSYDVIVVGGGPAGCVLASRLSEDPERQVLLIEAGPDYGSSFHDWPEELLDSRRVPQDSHPWEYHYARPDGGEPLELPRARVLGGTATINGTMWIRGSHADYDVWDELGNPGWGANDLLPYFKRVEADPLAGASQLHGAVGPVPVFRTSDDEQNDLERVLLATADELGFARLADMNGRDRQIPSVGPTPRNLSNHVRMNPALTYLELARGRPNLEVRSDTLVDRVVIDDGHATGVQTADGHLIEADEVILAAGSYSSPAILLRSGIGPADHLRDLGIEVIRDLPGVGMQLMDHPLTGNGLCEYLLAPGVVLEPFVRYFLKARSQQVDNEIDLHLYWFGRYDEELDERFINFRASLMYSRSQGRVRLSSPDPHDPPTIDLNYFDDPADLEALCDGLEIARRLAETPPAARMMTRVESELTWTSRDELRDLIRRTVSTTHHPSTTCKMGPASDPIAVVDQAGRVHGIENLRVADASIFPYSPRANLHFTICAVAEKIADLVKAS